MCPPPQPLCTSTRGGKGGGTGWAHHNYNKGRVTPRDPCLEAQHGNAFSAQCLRLAAYYIQPLPSRRVLRQHRLAGYWCFMTWFCAHFTAVCVYKKYTKTFKIAAGDFFCVPRLPYPTDVPPCHCRRGQQLECPRMLLSTVTRKTGKWTRLSGPAQLLRSVCITLATVASAMCQCLAVV